MKLKHIQWSTFLALGVLGAVFVVAYGTNSQFFATPKAESATNVNVIGYAWANTPQSPAGGDPTTDADQGLGWISFNGTNYGVTIDLETGYFSGYAWIGNELVAGEGSTGWVDFAPASGYPEAPNHGVWREGSTLTGWARVKSMYDENPSTGWIKMSGTATDGNPYGVTVAADGTFSGYAWGSDVIGWVDFAPAGAGFTPVQVEPIACTPSVVTSWGSCTEEITFCAGKSAGTSITGTQVGTCGFGYSSDQQSQTCDTGKTCGGSCPNGPSDCGGGEGCLSGTGKCGDSTTGCGNGTCDAGETLTSCPQDCKGGVQQF